MNSVEIWTPSYFFSLHIVWLFILLHISKYLQEPKQWKLSMCLAVMIWQGGKKSPSHHYKTDLEKKWEKSGYLEARRRPKYIVRFVKPLSLIISYSVPRGSFLNWISSCVIWFAIILRFAKKDPPYCGGVRHISGFVVVGIGYQKN